MDYPEINREASEQRPSADVLAPDTPVYVRCVCDGEERIELLRCVRHDADERVTVLEWLAENGAAGESCLPQTGQQVKCYLSSAGELFVIAGEILRIETTKPSLLTLGLEPQAQVYRLRRHERYHVWGRLGLGEPGDSDYFYHNRDPRPLNVSLGGFGLKLDPQGWKLGDRVRFALEAYLDKAGEPDWHLPVLRLRGEAVLRTRIQDPAAGPAEYFGFKYAELAGYQQRALQLWLATNQAYRRD